MQSAVHGGAAVAIEEVAARSSKAFSPDLLETEHYTIWPYARGIFYPPDTLYRVYQAMRADRSLSRVLYMEKWLDLEAFCTYFQRAALYIATTKDNETVLGAVWFTDVTQQTAHIGIWAVKAMRGLRAQQMVARVVEIAFLVHKWRAIWGMTPWKSALHLGLRIGFVHVATIPEGTMTARGTLLPMYVLKRENRLFTLNY